jgi:hypothetical protein
MGCQLWSTAARTRPKPTASRGSTRILHGMYARARHETRGTFSGHMKLYLMWLLRRCRRSRLSCSRLRPTRDYLLSLRSRGYPQVFRDMPNKDGFVPSRTCKCVPSTSLVRTSLIYELAWWYSSLCAWKAMIPSLE